MLLISNPLYVPGGPHNIILHNYVDNSNGKLRTIWKSIHYNNNLKGTKFSIQDSFHEGTVLKSRQFQLCMSHLMVFVTLIITTSCSK